MRKTTFLNHTISCIFLYATVFAAVFFCKAYQSVQKMYNLTIVIVFLMMLSSCSSAEFIIPTDFDVAVVYTTQEADNTQIIYYDEGIKECARQELAYGAFTDNFKPGESYGECFMLRQWGKPRGSSTMR